MDNHSIKDNICKFRKKLGMTQEDMANLLEISVTAYRELEKGNTNIVSTHILKMAELTNVPSEQIVLGYKPSQIENPEEAHEMEREYSGRINILEKQVEQQAQTIKHLEELVESKNEIIRMLKKIIGRDDKNQ